MLTLEQLSTRLPMDRALYGEIEGAIVASQFWKDDNTDPEFRSSRVYGGQFMQTDAARSLQQDMNTFFRSKKMPVQVFVITLEPDDIIDQAKAFQTNEHPNRFVVAADAGLTGKRGKLLLTMSAITAADDFDFTSVDPMRVARDIASTIRHELVHHSQYTQISKSMGVTRPAAKQHMEDWGLIPKGGSSRDEYLKSHIEHDAFGHEFAERLATEFGVEKSLALLASYGDGQLQALANQVDLGHNFNEFFTDNSDASFTHTLIKKIKKYLLRFQHHHIYERVIKRLEERKMKITKNKLRELIRESISQYREKMVRTSDMPSTNPHGPSLNVDFGAEPPADASYEAWKFRIETDILSDDMIAADEEDIRDLYNSWKSGSINWDEVTDYVLDLAY